ncbi:hypothetical protein [Paenibacillus alvei]|uniref:Uncharacterized protein n=1 Tax=Paenibacillus alvei TaxID=44250 RepID=A0AAP7A0P5_PAEAL|nr:hypothetical protein [Paenibacillus alvei]NOJ73211.1 hypothetical protein [Paenibacillus alvei]
MYDKQEWKDEIPDLSRPILDGTGKQKLDPQTGRPLWELVQEGTRITSSRLNHMENGIHSAHEVIDTDKHQNITLQPGIQLVDVPDAAPFRMGEIRGQTRLNILGRAGRCDDIDLWSSWQASKGSGSSFKGMSVTVYDGHDDGAAFIGVNNVQEGRYYLVVGNAEHDVSAKGARLGATFYAGDKVVDNTAVSNMSTGEYVRQPIHLAFSIPKGVNSLTVNLGVVANEEGARGFFDSIRLHEITFEEYMKLVGMKSDEVAKLYPYYDSMTNVKNPYAIATSGNLLPPLYNGVSSGVKVSFISEYEMSITTTKELQWYSLASLQVLPNTDYTLSVDHDGRISVYGVTAKEALVPNTTEGKTVTFNTKGNSLIDVNFSNAEGVEGTFTFQNPILTPTTTPQPFTPQSRSMWAAECQLAANPVDGTNADVLYVGDDGLPYVLEKWAKVTLDGSLNWSMGEATFSGGKQVKVAGMATGAVSGSGHAVKFDGKYIPGGSTGIAPDLQAVSVNGNFYISVSNKDSGWGDSYTPTADEIKAYFNGWKMYHVESGDYKSVYNGSGTKRFVSLVDWSTLSQTGVTPRELAVGFITYRLQYLKAKPTVEPVTNYETGLTFSKGWNMVEVGSGIVIREKAKFALNTANTHYCANTAEGSGDTPTPFRYRAEEILGIFKNQKAYIQWEKNIYAPNGKYRATIIKEYYDPTAVYHVTYMMLDPTLAAPISGSIATNLRGAVTDVVQWASDAERRLSVVETQKAEKDNAPQWIKATLINGAVSYSPEFTPHYCKDSFGVVRFKGAIKSIAALTVFLKLPSTFRPGYISNIPSDSWNNNGTRGNCSFNVNPDGDCVLTGITSDSGVSLDGISFLAEH